MCSKEKLQKNLNFYIKVLIEYRFLFVCVNKPDVAG